MDDELTQPSEAPEAKSSGASSWMANAAILMVFATLASAITGMLRDVAIGNQFGRGYVTDAFYNAATIPDFLYYLVAGGALRTGFVPVFTELVARGEEERAWRTFSSLFWLLTIVSMLLVGAGMLLAVPLANLINPSWAGPHTSETMRAILSALGLYHPGQLGNPEPLALCARIMRLMFPAQVFFLLGGLLMGALNARKHFLWPGIGPIVYNLAIIGAAYAASRLPTGMLTLGYGVLGGAFVGNFALQMFALRREGGKLLPVIELTPSVRKVMLLALPVVLGLAIAEVNFAITKVLANAVDADGGVSTLNYANRLWKLPGRVMGTGIAIALFPALAEHYARNLRDHFRWDFSFGIRNVIFWTLPSAALLAVLAEPSVRLLWPSFTDEGIHAVTVTLQWFNLGIVPLGIVAVAARAFYARHDTMTPVWIGVISVVTCITSAIMLKGPYGVAGLAMATSLSGIINATGLMWMLQVRVGGLGGREILDSSLRMIPATAALALAAWGTLVWLSGIPATGGMWRLMLVLAPSAVGTLAFLAVARLMRLRELESAWGLVAKRFGRR